jgi:transcriptional regulator with AAA-type ATPase domain
VRELQNVIERSVIVCDTDEFIVDESWLSDSLLSRASHRGDRWIGSKNILWRRNAGRVILIPLLGNLEASPGRQLRQHPGMRK